MQKQAARRSSATRYAAQMTTLKGLVQGNTILLDEAVPLLDGKRVLVVLEPVEGRPALAREQGSETWRSWVASGPGEPSRDKSEP